MVKDYVWTSDKLANEPLETVKLLRERAIAKANIELLVLCDNEIARRLPPKGPASQLDRKGQPVRGFHFVCKRDRGVVHNPDGTLWSGSWVVAKEHAERAERNNAYLALHESKSEQSYLQGIVKGWRTAPRDRQYSDVEAQTEEGIEFLVEPISTAFPWRGGGSGEKGYWYGDGEPHALHPPRAGDV